MRHAVGKAAGAWRGASTRVCTVWVNTLQYAKHLLVWAALGSGPLRPGLRRTGAVAKRA